MADRKHIGGTADDPTIKFLKIIPVPNGEETTWLCADGEWKTTPDIDVKEVKLEGFPESARSDGTWSMAFGFAEIALAERETKLNLLSGIGAFLNSSASASEFAGLLYAGLKKAHPKITYDIACRMLRFDRLQDLRILFVAAFNLSMPEKKRMVAVRSEEEESESQTSNSGTTAGQQQESTSA